MPDDLAALKRAFAAGFIAGRRSMQKKLREQRDWMEDAFDELDEAREAQAAAEAAAKATQALEDATKSRA